MRIYVCGPVTGMPDRNSEAFNAATGALVGAGYKVVNPLCLVPPDMENAKAMRRLIPELCACDGMCTLDGVSRSAGANVEMAVATACGMPVEPLSWWVRDLGSAER